MRLLHHHESGLCGTIWAAWQPEGPFFSLRPLGQSIITVSLAGARHFSDPWRWLCLTCSWFVGSFVYQLLSKNLRHQMNCADNHKSPWGENMLMSEGFNMAKAVRLTYPEKSTCLKKESQAIKPGCPALVVSWSPYFNQSVQSAMLKSVGNFVMLQVLAKKMTVLYALSQGQLSKQYHYAPFPWNTERVKVFLDMAIQAWVLEIWIYKYNNYTAFTFRDVFWRRLDLYWNMKHCHMKLFISSFTTQPIMGVRISNCERWNRCWWWLVIWSEPQEIFRKTRQIQLEVFARHPQFDICNPSVGWWENLQETPSFLVVNPSFPVKWPNNHFNDTMFFFWT